MDLADRADDPNLPGRRRPLPANVRAGVRSAGAEPPQPGTAAQRPHCSRPPAQPRAATRQRRTARLDDARKAEIVARKFRNHMRDMLFLFKGAPSASPFATWINDPREPEELPPDWSPAVPVAELLPDDPPF